MVTKLSTLSTKSVQSLAKFWRDEEGATAAEYGIIAALIAVAIIGAVTLLGNQLKAVFGKVTSAMN